MAFFEKRKKSWMSKNEQIMNNLNKINQYKSDHDKRPVSRRSSQRTSLNDESKFEDYALSSLQL